MLQLSELGKNVRRYRKYRGLTQRSLAEKLHVSTQAISSWEQGATYPDIENLCHLAQALSVTLDKLLMKQEDQDDVFMIAVDGGGTKAEFALFSTSGAVRKVLRLPGTNASVTGVPETLSILRRGIDQCLSLCPGVAHVFIGNAGAHLAQMQQSLSEVYTGIQFHIDSDGVNALMCVEDADAAMILGTGSILLRPEGDDFRRIGGWGYKLGDPGSAYNFGREACRAARAYQDGADPDPLIYSMVRERVSEEEFRRLGALAPSQIAALAPVIFEADRLGDQRARAIIQAQMQELAVFVRVCCPKGGKIAAVGGIVEHYSQRLIPLLSQLVGTDVEFVVPDLPPIYGACRACMKHYGFSPADTFQSRFRQEYLTGTK